MQPTRTTKATMRLLRAVALAITGLGASSIDSAAFPILRMGGPDQNGIGVRQIDNRTYRHCHNERRFVECYKSKFGQPNAPSAGRRAKYDRNAPADGSTRHEHHRLRNGGPP